MASAWDNGPFIWNLYCVSPSDRTRWRSSGNSRARSMGPDPPIFGSRSRSRGGQRRDISLDRNRKSPEGMLGKSPPPSSRPPRRFSIRTFGFEPAKPGPQIGQPEPTNPGAGIWTHVVGVFRLGSWALKIIRPRDGEWSGVSAFENGCCRYARRWEYLYFLAGVYRPAKVQVRFCGPRSVSNPGFKSPVCSLAGPDPARVLRTVFAGENWVD